MKSRAERLDEIFEILKARCVGDGAWKDWTGLAKSKLLTLFMECVPGKRDTKLKFERSLSECSENEGFNRAIKETLKNIEEIRG